MKALVLKGCFIQIGLEILVDCLSCGCEVLLGVPIERVWKDMITAPVSVDEEVAVELTGGHSPWDERDGGWRVGDEVSGGGGLASAVPGTKTRLLAYRGGWGPLVFGHLRLIFFVVPLLFFFVVTWRAGYVPDVHKCRHEWEGYTEVFWICEPQCLQELSFSVYDHMCDVDAV